MAELVLFHHGHGLTSGILEFAETLRASGHTVHAPDLFDGRRFERLEAGSAYAEKLGFETIIARGAEAVSDLRKELVYCGFSLGVLPAQYLAQSRPGASGAVLVHACVPVAEFSPVWPPEVPVQIHAMNGDPIFLGEGDFRAAREVITQCAEGELFLYPGTSHLFADPSLPGYDETATRSLTERVNGFLGARG